MVSYGPTVNIMMEACTRLEECNIHCEVIDVQSLIPFDLSHQIVESLKKTNRLVVIDEDFRGGASAFILQQILEDQGGYNQLDSPPLTITAQNHRTAGGRIGDYFSKPSTEDMFEAIYKMMTETHPTKYPPTPCLHRYMDKY